MYSKILEKVQEIGALIRAHPVITFLLDGQKVSIELDRIKLGIGIVGFLLAAWLISLV